MSEVTIYHNPRCSKSRGALALIEEAGVDVRVSEYLKSPPTRDELVGLVTALGVNVRDIMRSGEQAFKDLDLGRDGVSDKELLDAIVAHPILLERPIVVRDDKAVIGRPIENVAELL